MGKNTAGLSDVLFSKVRQRILVLFFNHPNSDFHTNEIIRLTDSGTGAVQRELATLSKSGIILVRQLGNQKRYQVNQKSPIYNELSSIVSKTFGIAENLRKILEPLTSSIYFAFIYGSVAKQEDRASSDIDILIIGDVNYGDIYSAFEKVENKIQRKINPTCYSSTDWKRKIKNNNHFIKKVMTQEKIMLLGSESELEEFR